MSATKWIEAALLIPLFVGLVGFLMMRLRRQRYVLEIPPRPFRPERPLPSWYWRLGLVRLGFWLMIVPAAFVRGWVFQFVVTTYLLLLLFPPIVLWVFRRRAWHQTPA